MRATKIPQFTIYVNCGIILLLLASGIKKIAKSFIPPYPIGGIMKTREVVCGSYIDPSTYVLTREDGSVFQTIREGEPFTIGNQLRSWTPVRVPHKSGRGTIMVLQKYRDNGEVLKQVPLLHNRWMLWAITSGAARRGVAHSYTRPQNELEAELSKLGTSPRSLERVEKIDIEIEAGGSLCHHINNPHGYLIYTDCEEEMLTEPQYVPDDFFNQYHRGCMESTYQARFHGGTYLVYVHITSTAAGWRRSHVDRVLITPQADEGKVLEVLKSLEK